MTTRHRIQAADGLQLSVLEGGVSSGPTVLFIHGYLFSSDVFQHQFAGELSRTHRLVAVDLRGHGDSDKPTDVEAYGDARTWADDIAAVVDQLDIDKALFVGWSLGSRVTLNYAWHHGFDRVAGLNLVAATLASSSHDSSAGLPDKLTGLLADDLDSRQRTTREFIDACFYPDKATGSAAEAFFAHAMDIPVAARLGAKCWSIPYDDSLSWVAAPTLITHGESDPLVPEQTSRAHVNAIAAAELSIIGNSGHLAFYQQPASYDAEIVAFMQRRCDMA